MNKLCVMVGLSASGKSSTIKELIANDKNDSVIHGLLAENTIVVSTDDIRSEICNGNVGDQSKNNKVFDIFHDRIRSGLLQGHNVIADATNLTKKSRKNILNCADGIDCYKLAVFVDKSIENCKIDDAHRKWPVSDYVIDRQANRLKSCPLSTNEGFDEIIIVNANKKR